MRVSSTMPLSRMIRVMPTLKRSDRYTARWIATIPAAMAVRSANPSDCCTNTIVATIAPAPGADPVEAARIAREIVAPEVRSLEGVSSADLSGGASAVLSIRIDPVKLAESGISVAQITGVIGANQITLPSGTIVEDGIRLHKYWFSVSAEEQYERFESRLTDPMRRWKLSPTDLESLTKWEDYSRAKDEMFVHTDLPEARWNVVDAEDKRAARINMIAHLLSRIPYEDVEAPTLQLPERPPSRGYVRPARSLQHEVPDHAATLEG